MRGKGARWGLRRRVRALVRSSYKAAEVYLRSRIGARTLENVDAALPERFESSSAANVDSSLIRPDQLLRR